MRFMASATALVALTVSALTMPALAGPPVPRKSPEFTFNDPSGKQVLLSSYRGKVVIVPFMFTTCPHCQREAQMLTKLQRDYGSRGLQVVGTVFNDANAAMATQFVKEFGIGFPVNYNTRDQVISYLGISVMDRWVVPQVAVLDRKGNIVAQSAATGTPELQDETFLRNLVEKLLKEGGSSTSAAPAAKPAPKTTASAAKK
jgi:peroxiredoxin